VITYATRCHDFSCGHRVVGHESHCAHLHGHNYRVHFTVEGKLDSVGRVLDFSVIKSKLCQWLEDNWDHRFLYWSEDTVINNTFSAMFDFRENARRALDRSGVDLGLPEWEKAVASFVPVPFNPTAENMGRYLLDVVGPEQLAGTGVTLTKVIVEETRKCSAEVYL